MKSAYRGRFCNPYNPLFPKLIEIRNEAEMPAPEVGAYIEIEDLIGAEVKQVGHFKNLAAWESFPHKGCGGVAIGPGEDIHSIAGLTVHDFQAGKIWWAVLSWPY